MNNKYKFIIDNRKPLRGRGQISNVELSVSPYRRSGNTTRAVDVYVQQLFDEGMTCLIDPYDGGEHSAANKVLTDVFKERMKLEHRSVDVKYQQDMDSKFYKVYALIK